MDCERGSCHNAAGVEIRPKPGFESGMGVLPGLPGGFAKTFSPLADALEQLGWGRGTTMQAHLYDWRWVRWGTLF